MPLSSQEAIHKCPLLCDLEEELCELLSRLAITRAYKKGVRIFDEGDACPGLFIVADGLVRIYKTSPSGKTHVLHFAEPGRTFAEVAALGGFPCPANAEALEPTTCIVLPTDDLMRLLRENHAFCRQLLTGMALWVRQLVDLLEDMALRDAKGRVARHLLEAAPAERGLAFELPMLRKDLASHIGLTSETLSRALRRLAERNWIALEDGGRIQILDTGALEDAARGIATE